MGNNCNFEGKTETATFDYFMEKYEISKENGFLDFPDNTGYLLVRKNNRYKRAYLTRLYFKSDQNILLVFSYCLKI